MEFKDLVDLVGRAGGPKVCIDSREVGPGDVFVAITGPNQDGHAFIPQAVACGAGYVVGQVMPATPIPGVVTLRVQDPTTAAALLAQASFGSPGSMLTNLAVTGTNGKTTIAYLVRSCMDKAGLMCGLISTVVYDTGSGVQASNLTTPDCLTLARLQAEMVRAGCKAMITEASSHALAQGRLAGMVFKAAAFTNLTGDHLDYHKTLQNYLAAKTLLFTGLAPQAVAVLNRDSDASEQIARQTQARVLWYGIDSPSDVTASIESMDARETVYTLRHCGRQVRVTSPLLGRHNVSNHLAAAGLCLATGLDLEAVARGLMALKVVPGRLERIAWDGGFSVVVDFAHTDDALRNVLTTLRPICPGRLTVVFGCGGDRDKTKRPRMARVAEALADRIVVTSDNPRTEDPEQIIRQIRAGFSDPAAARIQVVPDRRAAIEQALSQAQTRDVVLIAGKGHEPYQIIGKQKFPFSDQQVALDFIRTLMTP